ncbi:hypothetical protein GCM10009841_15920 [Microlunatus panaciterrae]
MSPWLVCRVAVLEATEVAFRIGWYVGCHPVTWPKTGTDRTTWPAAAAFPLPGGRSQTVRWKKAPLWSWRSHHGGNVKRKSSDRYEAARKKVVPAADEFVHTAAERIAPLVHDAADRVGPLAQSAADRVGPLAQSAADMVAPLAQSARDRVVPYAQQAAEAVTPYAHQAAERVAPLAHSAKQRSAKAAHDALDKYGPVLDDALDRVTPAVEAARHRVQDDLLPKLSEALEAAASSAVAVEATKRGRATAAALKGELAVPEKKKKGRWVKRLAIVAAVGGLAALAAKKLLGNNDNEWQAARPTAPYGSTTEAAKPTVWTDVSDTSAGGATAAGKQGEEKPGEEKPGEEKAAGEEKAEVAATAATELSESEGATAEGAGESGVEASSDGSGYGEGAYVGTEPPEGFVIKGNERSMKYHLPDSAGYTGTIAEVWFNSEAAAEAAGFTRAQR